MSSELWLAARRFAASASPCLLILSSFDLLSASVSHFMSSMPGKYDFFRLTSHRAGDGAVQSSFSVRPVVTRFRTLGLSTLKNQFPRFSECIRPPLISFWNWVSATVVVSHR